MGVESLVKIATSPAARVYWRALLMALKQKAKEVVSLSTGSDDYIDMVRDPKTGEYKAKGIRRLKKPKVNLVDKRLVPKKPKKLPTQKDLNNLKQDLLDSSTTALDKSGNIIYSYKELSFNPLTGQFFVISTGRVAFITRENAALILEQILSTNSQYLQLAVEAPYLAYRIRTSENNYYRVYSNNSLEFEQTTNQRVDLVIFADKDLKRELIALGPVGNDFQLGILFEADGTPYIAEYNKKTRTFTKVLSHIKFSLIPKTGYYLVSSHTKHTVLDPNNRAKSFYDLDYMEDNQIVEVEKQNNSPLKYRKIFQQEENKGSLRPKITLRFKDSETGKDIPLYFSASEGMLRQDDAHTRYSSNQHYLLTLFEIVESGMGFDWKNFVQVVKTNKYGKLAYLDFPYLITNDSPDRELSWNQREALIFYFLSMVKALDHLSSERSLKSRLNIQISPPKVMQNGQYSFTNSEITVVFSRPQVVNRFSVVIPYSSSNPQVIRLIVSGRVNSSQSWTQLNEISLFADSAGIYPEASRTGIEILEKDSTTAVEYREFKLRIVDVFGNSLPSSSGFNQNTFKLEYKHESHVPLVDINSVDALTDTSTNSFKLLRPLPRISNVQDKSDVDRAIAELLSRLAESFGVEAPSGYIVDLLSGNSGDHVIHSTDAIGTYTDGGNIVRIKLADTVRFYKGDVLNVVAHEFAHYLQDLTGVPWPVNLPQATKDEYSNYADTRQGENRSLEGFAYYVEENWKDLIIVKTGVLTEVAEGSYQVTRLEEVSFSPIQGLFMRRDPVTGEYKGSLDLTPAVAQLLLREIHNNQGVRNLPTVSNINGEIQYIDASSNVYRFDPRTGEFGQISTNYAANLVKFNVKPVEKVDLPPKYPNRGPGLMVFVNRIILKMFQSSTHATKTEETFHFVVKKDGTIEQKVNNILTCLSSFSSDSAYIQQGNLKIDSLFSDSMVIGIECDPADIYNSHITPKQIESLFSLLAVIRLSYRIEKDSIFFSNVVKGSTFSIQEIMSINVSPGDLQDINYIIEAVENLIKSKGSNKNSINLNHLITYKEINQLFNNGRGVPPDPHLKYKTIISRRLPNGQMRLFGIDKLGNEIQLLESELPAYYYHSSVRALLRIAGRK
jgi:hypothetical protein